MATRKILVLGSGMVARPCVEYLLRDQRNQVTVASKSSVQPGSKAWGLERTNCVAVDVGSETELDQQIAAHDLTISLVPYTFHAAIIKIAIKHKKPVVTTSYVSDAIRALDEPAKAAGITVLNEVGVDPGIDHFSAIKIIDEVHSKGGKVKEFYSYCGGLPAPEHADNPLKYKFSWSPRGVFLAARNSAKYFEGGEEVTIAADELMTKAKPYFVKEGYSFVAYANRDSTPFREFYNIPEAETVVRGSLRYDGNPAFIHALATLGWLEAKEQNWLKPGLTWAEIQQKITGAPDASESALIDRVKDICKFPDQTESDRIISGLKWIGVFSSTQAPVRASTTLDTLCAELEKRLMYQPEERDMVMLQHKFVIEWKDGSKETRTSTLELFGDPKGFSAMSLSVGVTCGIATQLSLDGHPALNKPGILQPYTTDICDPIREVAEKEGLAMIEEVV